MGVKLTNWDVAGKLFEFELPQKIEETVDWAVDEAQRIYSDSILQILEEQPSDWTAKSDEWAKRSGNKDLFFGEQGQFFVSVTSNNARGIRAKRGDKRVFVGARHDIVHHSGLTMQRLAEILQSTPDGSRDLFGRAYERVEDQINSVFRSVGMKLK